MFKTSSSGGANDKSCRLSHSHFPCNNLEICTLGSEERMQLENLAIEITIFEIGRGLSSDPVLRTYDFEENAIVWAKCTNFHWSIEFGTLYNIGCAAIRYAGHGIGKRTPLEREWWVGEVVRYVNHHVLIQIAWLSSGNWTLWSVYSGSLIG